MRFVVLARAGRAAVRIMPPSATQIGRTALPACGHRLITFRDAPVPVVR
jgi:hypothetical protein